ncbi:DUF2303 family protein [Vineibacter terrae]|uniref:DUF2303 family protein n=1 Tax=Vineibacter terrae TaxID=2586908 RepID=A0A5C8PA76_9HYPH|nr:DUF2303 family protein [Vineibacter terrae]TXL70138.1 DUF2303 family protein [Vineibacter terrae]
MQESQPALADLRQLAEFIQQNTRVPQTISVSRGTSDGAVAMLVPKGYALEDVKPILDAFRTRPERREGTAKLTDMASFTAWVNRHRDDGSVVFCKDNINDPSLLAIIDYDMAGPEQAALTYPRVDDGDDVIDEPGHRARNGKHRAMYTFPKSRVFEAWRNASGKPMDQGEFAAFLEQRLVDVLPPPTSVYADGREESALADPEIRKLIATLDKKLATPGDLARFARGIQITAGRMAKQELNRDTGEATVVYQEEHQGEGADKVKVPNLFLIAIPVLQNDPEAWLIAVHLRYRMAGSSVKWIVELHELERVWERVLAHACQTVEQATTITPLRGWPTAG